MSELTETTIPVVALMALQAENEALRQEVREWLCESCNWVYPGPPQPGLMCVICPRCKGFTGPFTSTKLRIVENELKAARAEIERLSDSVAEGLSKAIELLHRFSDHENQSCSFDHHGTCQEHNSEPPCVIAESRAFLALTQSPREKE